MFGNNASASLPRVGAETCRERVCGSDLETVLGHSRRWGKMKKKEEKRTIANKMASCTACPVIPAYVPSPKFSKGLQKYIKI